MNIAIFGGAFNPPHVGHKFVADSLIRKNIVDEVWFVPVFEHPWADRFGKHKFAPYDLRVKMIEALIGPRQKVAHYKDVSFTYNTLMYFQKKHPEHTFSWVMGSEYLARFDDFLIGHPKLLDFHFYIYPRAGHPLDEELKKPNMTYLENMQEVQASSTELRRRLAGDNYTSDLVVPEVLEIIKKNELFTDF